MTRRILAVLQIGIVLAACSSRGGADETVSATQRAQVVRIVRDALRTDPSILREAILALQADNARVTAEASRAVIDRRHNALFDPRDPAVGNLRGTIVIAEFFDPQCPYCRKLAPEMTHFLTRERDVRLIYKDLPILGPGSELGSRALLAAQRQGSYEPMRDAVMRDPREITVLSIRQTSDKLGLNWQQMEHDMGDPTIARKINTNQQLAKALGIDGTPAFVIDGTIISGADMTQIAAAVAAARRNGSQKELKRGAN